MTKEKFDLDNMYCGAIRRGDVFLYGGDPGGDKTVLVLQDSVLNDGLPTVVCASIEPYKKGEEVFSNEVLLLGSETGLGKDGICMLHRLITADRRSMLAKKGELKEDRLQDILGALDVNLGRFRDKN